MGGVILYFPFLKETSVISFSIRAIHGSSVLLSVTFSTFVEFFTIVLGSFCTSVVVSVSLVMLWFLLTLVFLLHPMSIPNNANT